MKEPRFARPPSHLTIRIRGHLSNRHLENFEAMRIKYLANGESLITGEVEDQAQLFGLLVLFRDLGIPILEMNCCEQDFIPQEKHDENHE